MAFRRSLFAPDEWYHCYSRGVDKRKTFEEPRDYERFAQSLYLCNSESPLHRDDLPSKQDETIFNIPRGSTLVAIGTYCLMPNHFHLLIQEKIDGGITRFMQKLGTAYTMYFNIKNDRVGGLFVKPFRSKHVSEDRYFAYVAQYIHLNPIELFSPRWKSGEVRPLVVLDKQLRGYPYSSLPEYVGSSRPQETILDVEAFNLLRNKLPPLQEIISEAAAYYQELN